MTAEQQGSDESGAGLTEAEREAIHAPHAVRINPTHVGCPLCRDYMDVVKRILSDRLAASNASGADLARGLHAQMVRAESAEAALATARREVEEMRARLAAVEALADEWEPRAKVPGRPESWWSVHAELRAALANPSAAQGESEAEPT